MNNNKYLIFSGSSNIPLAKKIVKNLKKNMGRANLGVFSDGEIRFQSWENVRGADVFIIQSFTKDINFHIMELLLIRKDRPRVPISAKLIADLLETSGFSRILAIDLHANQIQGFFNIPVDNLMALPIFISHFKKMKLKDLVIVSPDAGGVERARIFSQELKSGLAIADKRRADANVAEIMHIIGDVKDKNAIIVDDIVDTAGTMTETVKALKKNGAKKIFAACTHGVLSGKALERLTNSPIEKLFITDTIPLREELANSEKVKVLTVSNLFAQAISSINKETSVSKLFKSKR